MYISETTRWSWEELATQTHLLLVTAWVLLPRLIKLVSNFGVQSNAEVIVHYRQFFHLGQQPERKFNNWIIDMILVRGHQTHGAMSTTDPMEEIDGVPLWATASLLVLISLTLVLACIPISPVNCLISSRSLARVSRAAVWERERERERRDGKEIG